jgi:GNAT superfamily N-acetyltransferase
LSPSDSDHVKIGGHYEEVAPLLRDVVAASDANSDLLGFVQRGVFDEFARKNDLFVLTIGVGDKRTYAGHLLFERRYPRAKILQLFVLDEHRGKKYGRLLCDRLVELLTRDGFTSISARVGEDMQLANEAWQAMGFRVQRTELGGSTTGRTIVVRVRELEGPQLFPAHRVDTGDPFGVSRSLSAEPPLFLIDLNVVFDLSPARPRHDDIVALFQAERANFCKLAISEEMIAELSRTAPSGRNDPMLNLVRAFTRFPVANTAPGEQPTSQLAKLVFPHKASDSLSPNDLSDLRHLITAIQNDLAGLITSDEAILRAAPKIESTFGLQVLSPRAFLPEGNTAPALITYSTPTTDLELLPATDAIESEIRQLLARVGVSASELASGWSSRVSTAFIVRSGARLVAYMCWHSLRHDGVTTIRAALDETAPEIANIARGVITHSMSMTIDGPTTLCLKTPPNQTTLREIARGHGFCSAQGSHDLTKLSFGRVATKSNWQELRIKLADIAGLKMEGQFPIFRRMDQQIPYATCGGDHGYETLERIETLLSPALFCLPGRPAVITPIRHEFANLLLCHSRQSSLLPASSSNLFQERHFISGPNAFGLLKRGTLMLFYESNPPRGKGELVAVARVRRSYLKDAAALERADLARSVLTEETLFEIGRAKMKTVTVFDNLFPLPNLISLERLREIGCGRPHDLITSRKIAENHLQTILVESFKK